MILRTFCRIAALAYSACAFLTAPAVAAAGSDAPPGISATRTTLAQVLALHKAAAGVPPKTRYEKWNYTAEGLNGTQTSYTDGKDTREDDVLGPFQSASGSSRGKKWRQNENGLTLHLSGVHRESEINADALHNALRPHSAVSLLGETSTPVAAYVVLVDPPGGRKEWLFFDKVTHMIVRREMLWQDQRVISTFDDFRTTSGVTEAWHVHTTDGRPYNDEDYRLDVLQLGAAIDRSHFEIPADKRAIYSVPAARTAIPAKIIDDRIIITVSINGHNENFQLDSGASDIVIDSSAADKLGLKTYGRATGATAGTYVSHRAVIPNASVGSLKLSDVVVESLPFLNMADDKTFVIGLMGFDFIAGAVLHVNYLGGTVEAIDAASFAPPAGAIGVPVALDDGVPYAAGSVAGITPTNFIIDTGADRSTLFSTYAQKHPKAMVDQGLGQSMEASYPFVDHIMGVGGVINVHSAQLKDFGFAGLRFPQWLFMVTEERKSFEGEDFDGLVGQDFLRNFDVYFDYSRSMVYLLPNERFKQRWPGAIR